MTTAALFGGFLTFSAVPAEANHASPDELSILMPNDTYPEKDQLSDQFDGKDNLAHLTAVASVDTDNVTFYVCPADQQPFQDDGNSVRRNPGCDVIGTDEDGVHLSERDIHADPTSDEAYDVFWNISQDLDGARRDVFALACQGTGPGTADTLPPDDIPDNCIHDEESGVYLEDSTDEDDLIAGEIVSICTAPGSNNAVTDPNDPTAQENQCFENDEGERLDFAERPFVEGLAIHGGIVPNEGFTLRFTTSVDVDQSGACVAFPAGADDEPPSCDVSREASLEREFTTFKQWVVAFGDGHVPENEEIDLAIFGTPEEDAGLSVVECEGGTGNFTFGFLEDFTCVFDEHYVTSTARDVNDVVLTFDEKDDGHYDNQCAEPITEETNQLDDPHVVYACFTDPFGAAFPAAGDTINITMESEGPEGSGFSFCEGILHDHDDDGYDEHCHMNEGDYFTEDGANVFHAEVNSALIPGDQTVTSCIDGEAFKGTERETLPDHGCDEELEGPYGLIVKHWHTAPDQTKLVFSDGTPVTDECLTGDIFRQNAIGDTDELLVCTLDAQGNLTGTEPAGSGRLRWTIDPAGDVELSATRFVGNPPADTDAQGSALATIESLRQGTDIITVCLQNDPGGTAVVGDGDDCSSIEKHVTAPPDSPQCSDGRDNDGDGLIDFPADPSCVSEDDNSEEDAGEPTRRKHDRSVRIKGFDHVNFPNRRQLEVRIKVRHADDHGFGGCQKGVPVVLQIRADGRWIDRKSGTTNNKGVSKILIQDIPAKYRAKATRLVVENEDRNRIEVCRRAKSAGNRHRH